MHMKRFLSSVLLGAALVAGLATLSEVAAETDLQGQITGQITAGAAGAGLRAPKDPREAVANVIKIFLSIIGMVFLALTLLGGYWYLTAKGDETKVEKAKETIKGAITGLIIIMIAYGVTIFIGSKFSATVYEGGQTTTESRLP